MLDFSFHWWSWPHWELFLMHSRHSFLILIVLISAPLLTVTQLGINTWKFECQREKFITESKLLYTNTNIAKLTLEGSQIRIGNLISSPTSVLVALSKYSSQKRKISSSGWRRSFVRLNLLMREMLSMVDFKYQGGGGGFNLNMHSQAWQRHSN